MVDKPTGLVCHFWYNDDMAPSPELAERIRWFIRLRWLAVAGLVAAAALVASLDYPISWTTLVGLAAWSFGTASLGAM